jgi:hypothetical protein
MVYRVGTGLNRKRVTSAHGATMAPAHHFRVRMHHFRHQFFASSTGKTPFCTICTFPLNSPCREREREREERYRDEFSGNGAMVREIPENDANRGDNAKDGRKE